MLYLLCAVKMSSKKTNHSEISGSLDIDLMDTLLGCDIV